MIFLTGLIRKLGKKQVYALLALAAVAVVSGGIAFSAFESVSIGTGLYWAVTTATTVGYGDVTPHNTAGRVIAILEMLTAIPLFAGVFASVTASAATLKIRRLLEVEHHMPAGGYVAIYGSHAVVPRVARELVASGTRVVVVAADASGASLPDGVHVVAGDPTSEDVVRRSKPEQAARALVATADEGDALIAAVLLRHLAPDLPVTAIVHSEHVAHALGDLGIEQALSAEELIGHLVATSLETPHAPALVRSLLGTTGYVLREQVASPEQVGRSLAEIRSDQLELVLAIVHDDELDLGVGDTARVAAGDHLLLLADPEKRAGRSRPPA